ncbi:xanthine dehydrogenase family protein molybdopterin-binding subunit [Pseudomonas veronii]|uniref:xanthine dehydrogenase family protein molybdopterin-binding subunit n=1 Tax=Pseudomonas veronii TaxID=76761 RepID=UPI002D78BA7A|nr:molybdopterin cofactor-binding domain-containing protein [Pseudomonas veronii]WRU62636.1 molybdopterin cofactor-binding domain-containing protein [Pseudomonas veronii]
MAQQTGISRRLFMTGAAGLTLTIILAKQGLTRTESAPANLKTEVFNAWVSIAENGEVTIVSPVAEMGQGSMTSLPLILAEEMDADWSRVRIVQALADDKIYGNPGFGQVMHTAASASVSGYFTLLRTFGAQVRRVLLENVARHWNVPISQLATEPGMVVHAVSNRKISYGEIASFVQLPAQAPVIGPEDLKRTEDFRLIGVDKKRVELPQKINGSAQFAIDVQIPGMLYGAVLRSPVEGGAPDSIDDAAARAVPGVIDIVRLPYGIGVVASTPWAAFTAKSKLQASVKWRRIGLAWGFDSAKALDAFAEDARDITLPPNLDWFSKGDAVAALDTAATIIEAEYRCQYVYHAQMEPLNAVASVSPGGDAAELWCGTQYVTAATEATATALGIPVSNVTIHDTLLGGGFGRRGNFDQEFVIDAVLLSRESKRPVKVIWTREDDVKNGHFRPISAHYLRAGIDSSGKLVGWHQRVAGDRVLPFEDMPRFKRSNGRDYLLMKGVELETYDIPNQYTGQLVRDTGVRTSPLRGIGFTANKFVTESFLDEVIESIGADPLEFRLSLLKNLPRGLRVLERVAQMSDWYRSRGDTALGIAFIDYLDTLVAGVAEVAVDRSSGKIQVKNFWCTVDCGLAVQPDNIIAQMEGGLVLGLGMALSEEITLKDGAVQQSNFYDYTVMRMRDLPNFHIELIKTDNRPTGIGQMPVPIVAPAIGNAIAKLTGVRLRTTPMTSERLKVALG